MGPGDGTSEHTLQIMMARDVTISEMWDILLPLVVAKLGSIAF